MEPTDLTIRVLQEIRDEVRGTKEAVRSEIRGLSGRIDVTNERLDVTNERLDTFMARTGEAFAALQVRIGSELVAVRGSVEEVTATIRAHHADRGVLKAHDAAIADLRSRVTQLEQS